MRLSWLDPRRPAIAAGIHAVQMAAYAQEAALLGARRFPPLERTVADVRAAPERFLGALDGERIVAALGLLPEGEPGAAAASDITSLVVLPEWQRRGLGRRLVEAALAACAGGAITVSTGVANAPARALYAGLGFVEVRRRVVGAEPIEIVELLRPRVVG